MYYPDSLKNQTPLQVLSEFYSSMKEMKSQNESSVNNNDMKTLTDDDNKNTYDKINSFSDTIISEDAQNQLQHLPEPTLFPVQIPDAQPLDTFPGNDG